MDYLTKGNRDHLTRSSIICVTALSLIFMLAVFLFGGVEYEQTLELVVNGTSSDKLVFSKANITTTTTAATSSARKLLDSADEGDMNWVGAATCSTGDIEIYQGQTTPLPNGIPTYTVQVLNVCVSGGCSISNIHLSCGWFSSARLINPNLFRRICYDDCLVKDGNAMGPGEIISFQYANSFPFPLSVSSVAC